MVTHLIIDHHPEPILTELREEGVEVKRKVALSSKEIDALTKAGDIRSQIAACVREIPVAEGDEVAAGQLLIVLEAMKMLNNITSEINGKVGEIFVSPGDTVAVGDPLMTIGKD